MYLSVLSFFLPTGWIEHGEEMNACTLPSCIYHLAGQFFTPLEGIQFVRGFTLGFREIIIFSNMMNAATSILPICSAQ